MSRQRPSEAGASSSLARVTVARGPSLGSSREDKVTSLPSPSDDALRALVRALARQAARDHARSRGFAPREVGWVLIAGAVIAWIMFTLLGAGR